MAAQKKRTRKKASKPTKKRPLKTKGSVLSRRTKILAGLFAALVVGAAGWYLVASRALTTENATVQVSTTPSQKVAFQVGYDYTHQSRLFSGGNAEAVSSANALAKSLSAPQTTHILGFGLGTPNPSKGKYYWGDIDARVKAMRATTPSEQRTIILCCAPKWMKGTKTDADNTPDLEKAPTKAHYGDFATLSAEVAKHYPDVKQFLVWNELKGFWSNSKNRWDYEGYTDMYNQVYSAIKKVRPDAKVGGPYMGMNTAPPTPGSKETYGHLDLRSRDVLTYWMKNKKGADFVVVDSGPQMQNGRLATDGYTAAAMFADSAKYLRSLPGGASLPVWWAEFYPGNDKDNKGVDPTGQHAVSITMHSAVTAGLGGVNRMFVWEPEGEANGVHPYTGYGVWTSTAKSGGGKATAFYNSLKLLRDNFPEGTQLYKTTVKGNVTVMASQKKALLISKSKNPINVVLNGKKIALKPYEVKAVAR